MSRIKVVPYDEIDVVPEMKLKRLPSDRNAAMIIDVNEDLVVGVIDLNTKVDSLNCGALDGAIRREVERLRIAMLRGG